MIQNKDLDPVKSKQKKKRPKINKLTSLYERVATIKLID